MRLKFFLGIFMLWHSMYLHGQCPPPSFPNPGYSCTTAPILCPDLDGYCVNTGIAPALNPPIDIPECTFGTWVLNNPIWFAFFAATTTIELEISSSNCVQSGNLNGIQAGIYDDCMSNNMDLQCSCTTNDFTLFSNNYVPGEIYYIFIDGCAGANCDISISVLQGSTQQQPPGDAGPISGPDTVCVGSTHSFSIAPTAFTTDYIWVINPGNDTTITSSPTLNHNFTNAGTVDVCVTTSNQCITSQNPSCSTVEVIPIASADISGNGEFCANNPQPIDLTINFTGVAPWQFVYTINGVPQAPITTAQNPYTLTVNQVGAYAIQSVYSVTTGPSCTGFVSGNVSIAQNDLAVQSSITPSTCGQDDGSIDITVTGGHPDYTYNWNNSTSDEDLVNVPGGQSYTVTITDDSGCTIEETFTIPDNTVPITVTGVTTDNTTCNGMPNGSIDITATPANTNYVYSWSNGSSNEDQVDLPAGTYTVTVSNGVTCTGEQTFTISDTPDEPMATLSPTGTICGIGNGSVDLTVSGGVTPYTYLWSNGDVTEDITDVIAGTYTVTVTGDNGCTTTATTTITNTDPPITITPIITPNTACDAVSFDGEISITISPDPSPTNTTYVITWSTGDMDVTTITGLMDGTYSVTVTGEGNCTETATFVVPNQPEEPNLSLVPTDAECSENIGNIDLTVSGNSSPYTYIWSNGDTDEDLTDVAPGTYSVTVTGANGCTAESSATIGNQDPPITITPSTTDNTGCLPSSFDGTIDITISPATPPGNVPNYSIVWSTGDTDVTSLTDLPSGTYTVTVTAGSSCSSVATITVDENVIEPILNLDPEDATCGLTNGDIDLTVTGGAPSFTYIWDNGSTDEDLTDVAPGTYSVTVTGANGCTAESSATIGNQDPPITITPSTTDNTGCLPSSFDGTIDITISPATPPGNVPNYGIVWSTGDIDVTSLTDLPSGTYTVTVTAGGSCSSVATITVDENVIEPILNLDPEDATCGLTNGDIDLTVTGGAPSFTYIWDTGSTDEDLTDVAPGTYSVTVTGANGCTAESSATIGNQNPPITITPSTTDNTGCLPGSFDGTIDITISPVTPPGNVPNYGIVWSTGDIDVTSLTDLPSGTYTVTVTAGSSCSSVATITVDENINEPVLSLDSEDATCDLTNGDIDLTVSGGEPSFTYIWDNGSTDEDLADVAPGSYSVTVTGANGCTAESSITVGNQNPPISISSDITPNTACIAAGFDGSITIATNPSVPPGATNYTITWSTGDTDVYTISDLEQGTYSVTVDGGGSCTETATFTVPFDPEIPTLDYVSVNASCDLDNGSIDLMVLTGTDPFTYQWTNGETIEDLTDVGPGIFTVVVTAANGCTASINPIVDNDNPDITITPFITATQTCSSGVGDGSINIVINPSSSPTPQPYDITWSTGDMGLSLTDLPQGSYSVTVDAGGSCIAEGNYIVPSSPDYPYIALDSDPSFCGLSFGSIITDISGGQSPYQYLWSNGSTATQLDDLSPGTYTLTITDSNDCTSEESIDVDDDDIYPFIDVTLLDNTSCGTPNGEIEIFPDPSTLPNGQPWDVLWNNGDMNELLTDLVGGSYTVTLTAGTCEAVETFAISDIQNEPDIQAVITPELCSDGTGMIDITVTGGTGTPPFDFIWNTGATTEDLSNLSAGTYILTLTDAGGCTGTYSGNVANSTSDFTVTETIIHNTSCAAGNGSISLDITPAGSYDIIWSTGASTPIIDNLASGDYMVTVSAAGGGGNCESIATYTVEDQSVEVLAENTVSPAYCGLSNGAIDITVTQGTAPISYLWNDGSMDEDLMNVASGNYTVTITGAVNCTAVLNITVPEETIAITLDDVTTAQTSCLQPNGSIDLSIMPDASTLPSGMTYTVNWSNSSQNTNLTDLEAGTYTVTVSLGSAGCQVVQSITVDEDLDYPQLSIDATAATCGLSNGAVDLEIAGGAAPNQIAWDNGSTDEDLTGLAPGDYIVTVTSALGCSSEATATILNNNFAINLSATTTSNTSCSTPNGGIDLAVTPATPPNGTYSYTWSNSANTQDITNIPVGFYTVTVSAGGSCTAEATYEVLESISAPTIEAAITPTLCGDMNGAIDLTITPASAGPFTFQWMHGPILEDLTGLSDGTYMVTVTDANGCTAASTIAVPNNSQDFDATVASVQHVTRCDQMNGSIDIDITPAGSYDILWSSGQMTEDLSGLSPGIYDVTINEAGSTGCPAELSIIIEDQRDTIRLSQTMVPSECGLPDGAVDLTILGGQQPYDILWDNGAMTEDLIQIVGGTYVVDVTDANGCTATLTANVPDNSIDFSLSGTTAPNTSCDINTGYVDIDVTPTGSYTYTWSNSANTQDLNNVPGGTYTVTVSAGGTCTEERSFTVATTTNDPVLNTSSTPAHCGVNDGTIDLTITNGQSPFNISWDGGETSEDLVDLGPQTYFVTVTGDNGCSAVTSTTVSDELVNISLNSTITPNTSCSGSNGAINLTVTPSNPNYVFNWDTGAMTEDLVDLPQGSYTVTVSLGNTCSAEQTWDVMESTDTTVIVATIHSDTCDSQVGSILLSLTGNAPYTFNWSNGASTQDLTALAAGMYAVTITDVNQCTSVGSYVVNNTSNTFTYTTTSTANTSCSDYNGSIDLVLTPANLGYTYVWSTGADTQDLTDLNDGTYFFTVTDNSGCSATDSVLVDDNSLSPITMGQSTPVNCYGDSTGSIVISTTMGTPPYTYEWSPMVSDLLNLPSGIYNVTTTDDEGCSSENQFEVTQPISPVMMSCDIETPVSSSTAMDGVIEIVLSGGTPPYTFSWGGTGSQGTYSIQNIAIGSHSFQVTDAAGCIDSCSVFMTDQPCVTAVGEMDITAIDVCEGDCVQGIYDDLNEVLDVNDIRQFVLYEGSANMISNILSSSNTALFCYDSNIMTADVTYYIAAIIGLDDGMGQVDLSHYCTEVSNGTPVTFHSPPMVSAMTMDTITCGNKEATIIATSTDPNVDYFWYAQSGTISGPTDQPSITTSTADTYYVIATSRIAGCQDTAYATVEDESNIIQAFIQSSPGVILDCTIESVQLTGSATGSDNVSFQWSQGSTILSLEALLDVEKSGIYQLLATDTLTLCADTASINVINGIQYPPITISQPNDLNCIYTNVPLEGNSSISGLDYGWFYLDGLDTILVANSQTASASQIGNYLFTAFDPSNNCQNDTTVNVNGDFSTPIADAGLSVQLDCVIGEETLDGSNSSGTGNFTYQWTTTDGQIVSGATTPMPVINEPGSYTLEVIYDGNGCSNTDSVIVTTDGPVASALISDAACYGETGSLDINNVGGGTPPYEYALIGINSYSDENVYEDLPQGSYIAIVRDELGCTDSIKFTITEPSPITLIMDEVAVIAFGGHYQIEVSTNISPSDLSDITWTPSSTLSCDHCLNPIATPETSTTYLIEVVTVDGCTANNRVNIIVSRPDIYAPNAFHPGAGVTDNSHFTLFADTKAVSKISLLRIFDRWGELLFETRNIPPNNPSFGWDGTFRDRPMNPAVFVWYAEVEYKDGHVEKLNGDVTLTR